MESSNMRNRWQILAVVSALAFGVAAAPGQGPEIHPVMRQKLLHAQKILEAVVTSDWVGLETQTRALEDLTNDPGWSSLKYPEYARHSTAFVRAVQDLRRAAAQRDLEKAPKAYAAVILQCVECHRYLARSRIAGQ
jgi:hypothetical protein